MGLYSRIILAMGLILSLVFFQNCGDLKSGMNSSESNNNGQNADTNNGDFLKGDPYDASLIPFPLDDDESVDLANNYKNLAGYKAMAITEGGDIYVAANQSPLIADQNDWNEAVLERCQLFFMNQPCSLFAEGDVIAQDRDDFIVGFNSVITVPATFDGNLVPGAINHWQNHHATDYPNFTNNTFKAFAIGPTGATHPGWSQASQQEATRRALEFCESISDVPCALYAVGMDVVFDLEDYQWEAKRLTWGARPFNVDEIPFVPEAVRENIRTEYNQGFYFVLAMDRYGYFETVSSTAPITQADRNQALAGCNAKLPAPTGGGFARSCFIYSVDDQVVLTRGDYTMASYGY